MSDVAGALGKIPSGLFILTLERDGHRTGMLASWVMQASFNPPMITVAIRQGRYYGEWLEAGARAVINIVADGKSTLLSHFGKGFAPGEEAFAGLNLIDVAAGAPVIEGAVGYLAGTSAASIDAGDHRIFVIQVDDGGLLSAAPPRVHIRRDGLNY